MKYNVEFKPQSLKDLSHIPKSNVDRIFIGIKKVSANLRGDVKHLTNNTPEYRLRIGNYRILFEIVNNSLIIYRILHRKDAYKKR